MDALYRMHYGVSGKNVFIIFHVIRACNQNTIILTPGCPYKKTLLYTSMLGWIYVILHPNSLTDSQFSLWVASLYSLLWFIHA